MVQELPEVSCRLKIVLICVVVLLIILLETEIKDTMGLVRASKVFDKPNKVKLVCSIVPLNL